MLIICKIVKENYFKRCYIIPKSGKIAPLKYSAFPEAISKIEPNIKEKNHAGYISFLIRSVEYS